MKNFLAPLAFVILLASCGDKTTTIVVTNDSTKTDSVAVAPTFSVPVMYKDWEIGNPLYATTVVGFYKAWDDKSTDVASYFSDSVVLRIPDETDQIVVANAMINKTLKDNRAMYDSTSNDIISAVSLHDKESGEDWVMVTTYNKWVNKDGSRDSILYQDDWRLKAGKINLLMSFDKVPTKQLLKLIDPKKK